MGVNYVGGLVELLFFLVVVVLSGDGGIGGVGYCVVVVLYFV